MSRMVTVKCDTDLFEIVATLCSPRRFSCLLDGWEQQSNQHTNHCYHDKQFDQAEAGT